ncbi:hypothetical protein ASC77_20605 [Nocardioides sp. Root1257]|nr:hypothetical protein ASC77_20605 [Nocardioides sp. Root1257]KRC52550.1 hypothetical protein ASE24_25455 [Nocardioides sp. Root224]
MVRVLLGVVAGSVLRLSIPVIGATDASMSEIAETGRVGRSDQTSAWCEMGHTDTGAPSGPAGDTLPGGS